MTQVHATTNRGERGNALFLILIAVALFAALSYAITQSGRGSGTVDRESAIIAAGQVTDYPASLRTAITRMIITGTTAASITMDSTAVVGLFASDGGGAVQQTAPTSAGTGSWVYLDTHTKTHYVEGVGTDVTTTGADAMAFLPGITLTVCTQINKGLGFTNTAPATQQVAKFDPAAASAAFAAGGTANSVFANGASTALTSGQAFDCFNNTAADYSYYHVLIEQ